MQAPIETLESAPVTFDLEIPQRKMQDMPKALALTKDQGKVEASLKGQGTFLQPNLDMTFRATNLRSPDLPFSFATSGVVGITYDGKVIGLKGNAVAKKNEVLDFDAKANVLWADVLRMGPSPDVPWDASAHVVLNELPLQTLQPLADRSIKGNVSGEVSLVDYHKDAHASVQLVFDSLKVGKAKYTNGYVRSALTTDGTMSAVVRIDQTDGHAEASLTGGAIWGAALVPKIDGSKAVIAALDAKNVERGRRAAVPRRIFERARRTRRRASEGDDPSDRQLRKCKATSCCARASCSRRSSAKNSTTLPRRSTLTPSGGDTLAMADEIVAYGTTGKIWQKRPRACTACSSPAQTSSRSSVRRTSRYSSRRKVRIRRRLWHQHRFDHQAAAYGNGRRRSRSRLSTSPFRRSRRAACRI